MNTTASAGPVGEIALIQQQQFAAAAKNDADGFVVPFADDAVVTAFWMPFRVEGKAAIKEQFALFFEIYPDPKGHAAATHYAHLCQRHSCRAERLRR